ncbi:MAG: DNA-3-methyladenine glycosylase 2 family protein [Methylobacteriaceae bacterium]|nr:DNA-3-methyladenine glycosylase 2 family protein [Methylobacteriaceae bacterium]
MHVQKPRSKAGLRKRKPAARRAAKRKPDVKRAIAAVRPRRTRNGQAVNTYHPGPPIDGEAALEAALNALVARDPETIGNILAVAGPPPLRRREAGFEGLVSIIMSQQLSVASARAISTRLYERLVPFTPATVCAASDADLKGCGLSAAKVRTLRALSEAMVAGELALDRLGEMAPEEAHRALVAVKGIGPWTADTFLLACLGHPDAFPAGDLALQEAARLALKLETRPDTRALIALGERWRPHRAVAARLLWAYYRAAKGGREGMPLAGKP